MCAFSFSLSQPLYGEWQTWKMMPALHMFEGWSFFHISHFSVTYCFVYPCIFKDVKIVLLQLKGFTKQTGWWRSQDVVLLHDTKRAVCMTIVNYLCIIGYTSTLNVSFFLNPWNENEGGEKAREPLYSTCSLSAISGELTLRCSQTETTSHDASVLRRWGVKRIICHTTVPACEQ